jgi:plastocyanin
MKRFLAILIVGVALLGACSSDDDPPVEGATTTTAAGAGEGEATLLDMSAVDSAFDPTELAVPAGEEVTVTFTNTGDLPHTFTSEALGFDTSTVQPGESAEVTFTGPDAAADFECTIHGESAGMVGEIVPE